MKTSYIYIIGAVAVLGILAVTVTTLSSPNSARYQNQYPQDGGVIMSTTTVTTTTTQATSSTSTPQSVRNISVGATTTTKRTCENAGACNPGYRLDDRCVCVRE